MSETTIAAPPQKTARKTIAAVVAAIALLIASVGVGVWMVRDGVTSRVEADTDRAVADAEAVPDDLVRQDEPIYHAFDPPLVINIKDTDAVIEIGVSVATHYASVDAAMTADDPALRSAIILALADMPQDAAMSDAGKEQMLARIVAAVNARLKAAGNSGLVDSAYFTSFVVQGGVSE